MTSPSEYPKTRLALENDHRKMELFALRYAEECARVKGLGANICIGDNGFLKTTSNIDAGVPITAFPLHAIVNNSTKEIYETLEFSLAQSLNKLDVDQLASHHSWEHPMLKGCSVLYHPDVLSRKDSMAHLVKVVDNPYDGLNSGDVNAMAHVTARYLERIAHECNCRPAYSEDASQPFAMISLRRILPGEQLMAARTPLYFLYDDTELAEKIANVLANNPTDLENVREMLGLKT